MLSFSSPYRISAHRVATAPDETADTLGLAERLANRFVFGWALLRVGVCTVRGLDLEGFIALVIVVTAVASLARSLA